MNINPKHLFKVLMSHKDGLIVLDKEQKEHLWELYHTLKREEDPAMIHVNAWKDYLSTQQELPASPATKSAAKPVAVQQDNTALQEQIDALVQAMTLLEKQVSEQEEAIVILQNEVVEPLIQRVIKLMALSEEKVMPKKEIVVDKTLSPINRLRSVVQQRQNGST